MTSKDLTTTAALFLGDTRISFNFIEWSLDGRIPTEYHFSVPIFGDLVDKENLLNSFFQTAQDETGWQFLTDGVIFKPTVRDGYGIDRYDVMVSKGRADFYADLDTPKVIISEDALWQGLVTYMKALNIDDLMYVEANTTSVVIWRLKKGQDKVIKISAQGGDSGSTDDISVSNIKVDWQEIENKTKQETWDRIRKFLTITKPESEIKDVWANIMFAPKLRYESVLAKDILRADLTSNLHSVKMAALTALSDFGTKPDVKSVLLCTGDFAVSLEESHLLLALIDGLNLYGNIQIQIDKKDVFFSTLAVNIENDGSYTQAIHNVMDNRYTLISAEPIGDGDQDEVVLSGVLHSEVDKKEVFGLRNRIHKFYTEEPASFTLHPIRVKNVGGVEGDLVHHGLKGNIIVDTRDHDELIYGPEPRNNTGKVHTWLAGLR